eukprot:7714864-Ditylum_brightwellii.AAC.1
MSPTGCHGLLVAPLVSQTTKFPPRHSARHQKAYVFLPLPPLRRTRLHPPQESNPGVTATEQRALTN